MTFSLAQTDADIPHSVITSPKQMLTDAASHVGVRTDSTTRTAMT